MNVLILGATGLVGKNLLTLLEADKRISNIFLLSRRELDIRNFNITNNVVDFKTIDKLPIVRKIDVLFIAFGTTLRKAGSQETQKYVDVEIPTKIMKLAREAGIENCVLVSALGVSKSSPFFYSRMKAELDENAQKMGFKKLILIKPSFLEGPRVDQSLTEKWSIMVGNFIGKSGLINRYKPVDSINVAKSMIQSYFDFPDGFHEVTNNKIDALAQKYSANLDNIKS